MSGQQYPIKLLIENQLVCLDQVSPWLEQAWLECDLPEALRFEMGLCLYEAVANVVMYAFDDLDGYMMASDAVAHVIEISLILHNNAIEFTIQDDGRPFDPLTQEERPRATTIAEAQLGGRGIPLMRGLSDKLEYRRSNSYNYLSIIKNITAPRGKKC